MEHNMCTCCEGDATTCQTNKAANNCNCEVCPCAPAAGEVAEEAAESVVD